MKGSRYTKAGKRKVPFRYSDLLAKLTAARRDGDHDEAEKLAAQHSAVYGLRKRFTLASIRIDDDDEDEYATE